MHLNESLTGIRVVKAFAQEDYENDKFATAATMNCAMQALRRTRAGLPSSAR